MDFESNLEWRLRIRQRHRMPRSAVEFAFHGGRAFLLEWGPHSHDAERAHVTQQHLIDGRFHEIAERTDRIVDRFYCELALKAPSTGFHWHNVQHALILSTGCLRVAAEWFQICTAPAEVVEELFVGVRNAMGALATSSDKLSLTEAEAAMEAAIRAMDDRRRRANCAAMRIVA